ncbi:MAG: UDP-N-acetyl glucosamine 2-epimerase [Candidatus Edwardsbacteria bacterium]
MKIVSVVGARPQFIKVAPLYREFSKKNNVRHIIVHTGQHYDYLMSKVFFDELGIPEPDYSLEVGSGIHGWQTGEMLKRIEEVLLQEKPDCVIVYGDTNSTLAGALAAAKLHIPVAHIEAGLRSYDKYMPEEIDRVLTDHISSILFCPTETAVRNLQKEGFNGIVNNGKLIDDSLNLLHPSYPSSSALDILAPVIINVGDIMYDALLICFEIAEEKSNILSTYNLSPKSYYLATVHRAENTDNEENLKNIFEALVEIGKEKPVIVPLHPRTRKVLESLNFLLPTSYSLLRIINPVSYFDMLLLEKNACKILTDSGGVQKEAYLLEVPCVTLRNDSEWVEIVENKWNIIVGASGKKIINATINASPITFHTSQDTFGKGDTARKVVKILQAKSGEAGFYCQEDD